MESTTEVVNGRPRRAARRTMHSMLAVLTVGAVAAGLGAGPVATPSTGRAVGAGVDTLTQAATATERATRTPPVTTAPDPNGTGTGQWIVNCPYSHTLSDDPIIFPNQPGTSHSHEFMGSTDTKATSTEASMRAARTTCGIAGDTAGYWVPTLSQNGVVIHPVDKQPGLRGATSSQNIYYRSPTGRPTNPIPPGLRMISGNSKASGAAENPRLGRDIWWGCSDNSIPDKLVAPPPTCPEGIITLHVHFPDCWNGRDLDSPDHISHMAWSSQGRCPASHPKLIPEVTIRLEWVVGVTTGDISLASGATHTIHGDFWNTWDQPTLDGLITNCINANKDCGKFRNR